MNIPGGLGAASNLPEAIFTDFRSLDSLRESANADSNASTSVTSVEERDDNDTLTEAARQFSSIFLHMALKSMREASFGGGMLDSKQSEFYRDMFDQQIALDLSQGEGFGLTQVIVDQLSPRLEPAGPLVSQLDAAKAYARVARDSEAKEFPAEADSDTSSPAQSLLGELHQSVVPDVTETTRMAIP